MTASGRKTEAPSSTTGTNTVLEANDTSSHPTNTSTKRYSAYRQNQPTVRLIYDDKTLVYIAVSASVFVAILLVVVIFAILLILRRRRQSTEDGMIIDTKPTEKVWVSHAVLPATGDPVKGIYQLERNLQQHGFQCRSALLCQTELANKGFYEVYNLMDCVDKIVVCCDSEYKRRWDGAASCSRASAKTGEDPAFVHEHIAIVNETTLNGYRRFVVVLLGDATPDCIPHCLRATQCYKFPNNHDFLNIIHRLQDTEPIALPCNLQEGSFSTSSDDLLEKTDSAEELSV